MAEIKELLGEVLPFAQHKSGCGALGVMWDKHPCDCGWEKLEKRLEKEGILPPTRRCEHCGRQVEKLSLSRMGVCSSCSSVLCYDCLHGEPGTCERSPTNMHTYDPPAPPQ